MNTLSMAVTLLYVIVGGMIVIPLLGTLLVVILEDREMDAKSPHALWRQERAGWIRTHPEPEQPWRLSHYTISVDRVLYLMSLMGLIGLGLGWWIRLMWN